MQLTIITARRETEMSRRVQQWCRITHPSTGWLRSRGQYQMVGDWKGIKTIFVFAYIPIGMV